ncbi:hypothetical protein QSJ18_04435 [Gordonia sp. ABSL1-1]|uniref:hypothetical protein n=1 Tax=Gordonia sp. ABSL1-1 TaxID=3053923 RepID=UPI002572452C|nr:hypothetical protein [Gordonia sp. ABSL1-1]MDL9935986.1 hypothetical protein [Gordonia sp. ABSL1-1]
MAKRLKVSTTPFRPAAAQARNASGVVDLGGGRCAFVDNRDGSALLELALDADGAQVGPLLTRPLSGVAHGDLTDPEGLTLVDYAGTRYLIAASSLGARRKGVDPPGGLVRIIYSPDGHLHAESIPDFRGWLLEHYPALRKAAGRTPDDGGLNIEGVAWDPSRGELLFGLRSPTAPPHAMVLRVGLDASAPWTRAALTAGPTLLVCSSTSPTKGIRDLTYDPGCQQFLLLLGRSVGGHQGVPFELCTWDGTNTETTTLPVKFAGSMKPEGVTVFTVDDDRHVLIVDDGGGFATIRACNLPGWS